MILVKNENAALLAVECECAHLALVGEGLEVLDEDVVDTGGQGLPVLVLRVIVGGGEPGAINQSINPLN